jgi:hypothetical protein
VNRQPPIQVLLGRISLEKELLDCEKPQEIEIKKIIIHNKFTSRKKYNDIALLELKTPAEFSNEARPACLGAPKNFVLNESQKLTVTGRDVKKSFILVPRSVCEFQLIFLIFSGWGITNTKTRKPSPLLLKGGIDFVPRSQCNEDVKTFISGPLSDGIVDSQICAGDPNDIGGVDACQVKRI